MGFSRRALLRHLICGICAGWPVAAEARRPHAKRRVRTHDLPLVVIDPGHGGKDPGCSGPSGVEEKHIVLAIGLELRRRLLLTHRCRVAMTRAGDVFVPLEQRVRFAQQRRAALFISLHANASPEHGVSGASVYRFAFHASDAATRALAAFENSADRIGGPAFRDASPSVTHILASLMRRETWIHSAWLQKDLVAAMRHRVRMTPIPARHAHFVVLSAPDIPSVLVETGFLTNSQDEKLLCSPRYRRRMAQLITHAVEHDMHRLASVGATVG